MGNKIGVEVNPIEFGDFLQRLKENETNPAPEAEKMTYRNVIRIWELIQDRDDEFSVITKPFKLLEQTTLSETSSYILLHTTLKHTSIVTAQKPNEENTQQSNIETFIQTSKNSLSPRGQSAVYSGYHSNNMSQKKTKNKLIHDIYLWNGNKVPQLIKAVASSKVLELENLISDNSLNYLLSSHSSSSIEPLSKLYSDLVIDMNTKKQLAFNHLFALISKQNLPPEFRQTKREGKSHRSSSSVRDLRDKKIRSGSIISSDDVRPKRKESINRRKFSKAPEYEGNGTPPIGQETKKEKEKLDIKEKKLNYRSISLPSKQISQVKARLKLEEAANGSSNLFIDVTQITDSLKDVSRPPSQERIKRLAKICSKINDNLYLGSDTIAQDKAELQRHGITHILNCAGAVCANYHADSFVYKTLYLNDGKTEDIFCVFYEVLEFMDDAIKNGGKVFVHCHQGISRSSSMVILYEMWKNRTPFAETHEKVKKFREVSNPNPGFMCQLINWWNRISQSMLTPRCYHVVPHCSSAPTMFILKLIEGDNLSSYLDSRGCFIIHDIGTLYLWKGKESYPLAYQWAEIYITRLQRFEKAPDLVKYEVQGDASSEFRFIMGSNLNSIGRKPENDEYFKLIQIAQNILDGVPADQLMNGDSKKGKKDKSKKKKEKVEKIKTKKTSLLHF